MFNKLKGALLGYIVGDALGVPVEFKARETLKNIQFVRWLDMEHIINQREHGMMIQV